MSSALHSDLKAWFTSVILDPLIEDIVIGDDERVLLAGK